MLDIFDHIPDGLLDLDSTQLWQLLKRPALIHLEGDRQPALFVSILLHGNETTSWLAMRELFRKYQNQKLQYYIIWYLYHHMIYRDIKGFHTIIKLKVSNILIRVSYRKLNQEHLKLHFHVL